MTGRTTIALEFARECMGWEHCDKGCSREWIVRDQESFDYIDSNAVIAAVQGWCDEHEGAVEIRYFGYVPGEWEVDVSTPHGIESITCTDLCHALMAACLMASRKLKVST